ncbi:hypothetical protein WJX72_005570 [[Myrmecia] bisecta]|uniref:Uncharacterized protein n=1 Tax=[Myrmecia] bisecta TaxID=41462 RepID=A0AAW1R6V3_9CHLO
MPSSTWSWSYVREQEAARPSPAFAVQIPGSLPTPAKHHAPDAGLTAAEDLLSCQERVNLDLWEDDEAPTAAATSPAVEVSDLSFSEWATSSSLAALREEFAVKPPAPCNSSDSSGSSSSNQDSCCQLDLAAASRRSAAKCEELASTATSTNCSPAKKKRKSRSVFSLMGSWGASHHSYTATSIF